MKNLKWLPLAASVGLLLFAASAGAQVAQAPVTLSPPAAEVVKLAQSGTTDDVLLAYIQNSSSPFTLTADQILYLKDVGVSSAAISGMLNRDAALRNQPQYSYDQRLYPPASPPPAQAPVPAEPAPNATALVPTEAPPPTDAPGPAYVSNPPPDVGYFYSDLAPYGTWVDLPNYGWCWQPTVVAINHGWRPYCDAGHWVWTDAGWYWGSDYSWGWAPFHYGRWFTDARCGWVWLPDRVWGPSWVCWRTAGDVCGWAPLPPHAEFDVNLGWRFNGVRVGLNFDFGLGAGLFTFCGYKDFCAHDVGRRCLAPAEVTRVYNRTTINNHYVVNNHTIINQGVKVELVAAASHTEIHKAAIRDLPAGSSHSTRLVTEKNGPVVYRPQLSAPAKPVRMVAQKLDQQHPVIQHTELAPVRAQAGSTSTTGRSPSSSAPGSYPYQAPRSVAPTPTERPANTRQEQSSGGLSSHVYYPKSYHQAADVRSLPPLSSYGDSASPSGNNSKNSSKKN